MAQGANKLKSKGNPLKKDKHRQKKQNLKKGARFIAPKKAKVVEQSKLKRGLEQAIKSNIEQEITQKVKSVEGKAFSVVSTPSTSSDKSKNDSVKTKNK